MLKRFVDLRIHPPYQNGISLEKMARMAYELGFSLAGLVFESHATTEQVAEARAVFRTYGVDTATRINLAPRSKNELLQALRRHRKFFELIGVDCASRAVALVAARDRRVDLLTFRPETYGVNLQRSIAHVCRAGLEVDLSRLIYPTDSRPASLEALRREAAIAIENRLRVVLSSGAPDSLRLRAPLELAALSTLIGLSFEGGLNSISQIPLDMVRRNREKMHRNYITEGVRVG